MNVKTDGNARQARSEAPHSRGLTEQRQALLLTARVAGKVVHTSCDIDILQLSLQQRGAREGEWCVWMRGSRAVSSFQYSSCSLLFIGHDDNVFVL